MADAILYGIAQKIIETLGSSTLKQIGSIWGVKDDLRKMKNTVSTIQAVLQDAEEQQDKSHQVKDWLMKLRDAVFDADDLLSEFSTHVLRQNVIGGDKMAKKVRLFFSSSNQLVFSLNMACKIKAMRERLNDISNDRHQFQLKLIDCPLETQVVTRGRDQTHSFVPDEDVIGREKDKQAIIDLLLDFDVEDNVSFISIVGIGGLGKTTLAQYVFNDDEGTNKESTLKKLISTFRYLRALDLHGLNMKMLPKTIGTLMHLKYLDLFSNDIEVLPSSITNW